MRKLLLTLAAIIGFGIAATAQEPIYDLQFNYQTNSKKVSGYTPETTFYVESNGVKFNLVAFNNNSNGGGEQNSQTNQRWTFVRCGSKSFASVATITSEKAITEAINKVVISARRFKNKSAKKAELLVADNADFNNATSFDITKEINALTTAASPIDITVNITSPAAGKFYQFKVDSEQQSDGNGWFELHSVKYYGENGGTVGIDEIGADENATVEYFNLQGGRVANPENGLFIRRQGNKVAKVYVK